MPIRRAPKRIAAVLGLAALATLVLLGVYHRPIVSRAVTRSALADATEVTQEAAEKKIPSAVNETFEKGVESLAARYGPFFRRGYIDRGEIIRRIPLSGITLEAGPALLVIAAFYKADEERIEARCAGPGDEESFYVEEIIAWLLPCIARSETAETLVNVLTADWALMPTDTDAGLPKRFLAGLIFSRPPAKPFDALLPNTPDDDPGRILSRVIEEVPASGWEAILANCGHPRDKVRAGSLILLSRSPSVPVFFDRARRALDDPEPLPRLAAAGLLALGGDGSGEAILLEGLDHPRWEIRFWAAASLASLGKADHGAPICARRRIEEDPWLAEVLAKIEELLQQGGKASGEKDPTPRAVRPESRP